MKMVGVRASSPTGRRLKRGAGCVPSHPVTDAEARADRKFGTCPADELLLGRSFLARGGAVAGF